MPITVNWDDDAHQVIRYDLSGKWTWEEFWQAYEQAEAMMQSIDYKIHYILNSTDAVSAGHIPNGVFSQIPRFYKNSHSLAGRTVRVPLPNEGLNRMWQSVATRLFPKISQRIMFANTLDEARTLIRSWLAEETRVKRED